MNPFRAFLYCFKQCLTNISCAPFFLFAIFFYSLYYCWPYIPQHPDHIKTVIVDLDNTPLSERLAYSLNSVPALKIIGKVNEPAPAKDKLQKGQASTIITIPVNFQKNALNATPTALTLVTNGALIVKARSSLSGLAGPLQQVIEQTVATHLVEHGTPIETIARIQRKSAPLILESMFNTVNGYLNFTVPIVFVIIIQTAIVAGIGMLFNDWFCQIRYPKALTLSFGQPRYFVALCLPFLILCFTWVLLIEGFSFSWHGVNSFQNVISTVLSGMFFSYAVIAFGVLLSVFLKQTKLIVQLVVPTSIPCIFISGNLFPEQNIPLIIRVFSWIFPSTPGVHCLVLSSQTGAGYNACLPSWIHLLTLGSIYFVAAYLITKPYQFDQQALSEAN